MITAEDASFAAELAAAEAAAAPLVPDNHSSNSVCIMQTRLALVA